MATPAPPLVDQFGRPVSSREAPAPNRLAVASVRDTWYQYPSHGLTPERLATILKEADAGDPARQAELFEEMIEKDGKLGSLLQMRILAVEALDWAIEPADGSPEARRAADFAREALPAEVLGGAIAHLLQAIPYGYAGAELLWARVGRVLTLSAIEPVETRRFTWLPRGSEPLPAAPRLLTDEAPVYGRELPPWKFVLHRYRARAGSVTRAGLMRACAWLWIFKHYAWKDWVAFAEVYGMPLRLGKYQPGASQDDREALLAAVRAIGHDAAGIISASTEIEFIKAAERPGPDLYQVLIELCNKEMALAVLGQTLTSEVGTIGSLAAAKVHEQVRFELTVADSQALSRTVTAHILRPLVGFNLGWEVPIPRFRPLIEPPEDLLQTATMLKTLVEAGGAPMIPAAYVHEKFKIRRPNAGEPTLADMQPPGPGGSAALKVLPLAARPAGETFAAAETLTDHLTDEEWARVLVPLLEPLHRLAQEATSLEDFRARLADAYREADPALLARALALAMRWGWIDADGARREARGHE